MYDVMIWSIDRPYPTMIGKSDLKNMSGVYGISGITGDKHVRLIGEVAIFNYSNLFDLKEAYEGLRMERSKLELEVSQYISKPDEQTAKSLVWANDQLADKRERLTKRLQEQFQEEIEECLEL